MKDILKRLLLKHFQKRSLPSFPHLCIVYLYSKIVLTVLCSVLSATNSSQGRNYFYLQRFRDSEYTGKYPLTPGKGPRWFLYQHPGGFVSAPRWFCIRSPEMTCTRTQTRFLCRTHIFLCQDPGDFPI